MSKDNKQDDSSAGEGMNGEELIKRTFLGVNQAEINKGDKIRVFKGDLNGLNGTVISIENGYVIFKPIIPGQKFSDNLKLDSSFVVKYFEPGD